MNLLFKKIITSFFFLLPMVQYIIHDEIHGGILDCLFLSLQYQGMISFSLLIWKWVMVPNVVKVHKYGLEAENKTNKHINKNE